MSDDPARAQPAATPLDTSARGSDGAPIVLTTAAPRFRGPRQLTEAQRAELVCGNCEKLAAHLAAVEAEKEAAETRYRVMELSRQAIGDHLVEKLEAAEAEAARLRTQLEEAHANYARLHNGLRESYEFGTRENDRAATAEAELARLRAGIAALPRYNWASGMAHGTTPQPHWRRDDKYGEVVQRKDLDKILAPETPTP